MNPKKKVFAKRGTKIPKNLRPGRPCPHCGRIRSGSVGKAAPHKPGGLRQLRALRQKKLAATAVTRPPAHPAKPDPIDAVTVIKGVVERIPEALESAAADALAPTSVLNTAVRKAVLDEFRTRAQFAGRIAEIDALLWSQGARGGDTISGAMEAHLRDLRLIRLTVPEQSDRFVVTEGEGEAFELLRPAYVDELTGKVLLAGHLRRVPGPANTVVEEEA